MNQLLHIKEEAHVSTVTIHRPESDNSLTRETLAELNNYFSEIEHRPEIRALIITGEGNRAFSIGADLPELLQYTPSEAASLAALANETFCRLERMPAVTIAAVGGYALGGGCELAMSCDIRIASYDSFFGQPEINYGIIPGFGGTQRLPRIIGKGRALELILTGEIITAEEAYRIGLVNKLVDRVGLLPTARILAGKIIAKSGFAVSLAKSCIHQGMEMSMEEGLALETGAFKEAFASPDRREGITAHLEHRRPDFADV